MKNAPITTPPPQMFASRNLGSNPCPPKSPTTRVNPPRTEKQISPWMMSSPHRINPPISIARTELPITPFVVPRNICVILTVLPARRSATGVAEEIPSTPRGNLVIAFPNEIIRKHLAASAGFTKFLPRPPKAHLTTRIANIEPRIGMYSGTVGDSDSASIMPVTAADPSRIESLRFVMAQNSHSEPTAATIDARMMNRECHPFTMTPTTAVGRSASNTVCMINEVVQRSRICGPWERCNVLICSLLLPPHVCGP